MNIKNKMKIPPDSENCPDRHPGDNPPHHLNLLQNT